MPNKTHLFDIAVFRQDGEIASTRHYHSGWSDPSRRKVLRQAIVSLTAQCTDMGEDFVSLLLPEERDELRKALDRLKEAPV